MPPEGWYRVFACCLNTPNTHSQDQDLWNEDGDCLVHFHAQGSSQRPPSLKISFAAVQSSNCSYLLEDCLVTRRVSSSVTLSDSGNDSSASSSHDTKIRELFIPSPVDSSKDRAYTYHVTTRNFFALLTNQALVGPKLGLALVELWQRTKEWQPSVDATATLLSYCEQQGYLSLADNVTHATAILHFAEKARIQDLWTNAFVHCVGMHERLDLSPDYRELSNYTRALVTRASLEMDLHLTRVTRALGCFLEEELGTDCLGLSKQARQHLDRFRCFLHSYYMEQFGYFPPNSSELYDKRTWSTLHDDFQSLYDLLADTASDRDIQNDSNASGGICCLQNTEAFDLRHGCDPLPHPSPLLPSVAPENRSTDNQRTMRSLRLGRSSSSAKVILPPRKALADATNTLSDKLASKSIIQEYRHFENMRPEEKVSVQEARKIRWLLVYSSLQMLKSITRAPQGVNEIDATSYPLCVLTTGSPEWRDDEGDYFTTKDVTNEPAPALRIQTQLPLTPDETPVRPDSAGRISIHPDCEADSATEYFSNSRRSSVNALELTPPPLRINRPARTASIRNSISSGANVLQRSFSMARKNSSQKSAQRPRNSRANSYEVVGQGYGIQKEFSNKEALEDLEGAEYAPMHTSVGTIHNPWQEFDFGLQYVAEEPTMNDLHLDSAFGLDYLHANEELSSVAEKVSENDRLERLEEEDEDSSKNRNSWTVDEAAFTAARWPAFDEPASATTYSSNPDSLRSSYLADGCDTPVTIYSSPSESPVSSKRGSVDSEKAYVAPRLLYQQTRPKHISLVEASSGSPAKPSLNAGCYCPSGTPGKPTYAPARSRFSMSRTNSVASEDFATAPGTVRRVESVASSVYQLGSQQADDMEAEDARGRRRTRMSAGFAGFSFYN